MKTIKTIVDDENYAKLVKMRKDQGLPSISALFMKKTVGLTPALEAEQIVSRALKAAKVRPLNELFILRDLFPRDQWNKFDRSARLQAGRAFYARISAARDGIIPGPKTQANHQQYKRTS